MIITDLATLPSVSAPCPTSMLEIPSQAIRGLWQEDIGNILMVVVDDQLVIALINVLKIGLMQLTLDTRKEILLLVISQLVNLGVVLGVVLDT